jgi:AcrR family transcriptional regulator
MVIPVHRDSSWSTLDADGKRERLLRAASEVFARSGLDAPMPEIAAAAGAGIGSVYRQFPSKRELLAALVIERLEAVTADAEAAIASPDGPWAALVGLLHDYAERQAGDDVVGEAIACLSTDPDVALAYAATNAALERLLAAGREQGRLRPDATAEDLRLIFAATRAAVQREPGAWRRMLELGIDSLDTQRNSAR